MGLGEYLTLSATGQTLPGALQLLKGHDNIMSWQMELRLQVFSVCMKPTGSYFRHLGLVSENNSHYIVCILFRDAPI